MASLDSLSVRALNKKGVVLFGQTDTPVAIRLRAKTAAGAITSVTVTTATNIVFVTAAGTQTYAFASKTTVGALVDAINVGDCTEAAGGQLFEARVLDTLRSKATASQFVNGAISASTTDGVSYYDVKCDTSACLYIAKRLSMDRSVGENMAKGNHRVHLQEIKYAIDMGTAAADSVQVWECDGSNETQLFGLLSVDTTATTINFSAGEGLLTAKDGAELVVLVKDAATLADNAANYLQLSGWAE